MARRRPVQGPALLVSAAVLRELCIHCARHTSSTRSDPPPAHCHIEQGEGPAQRWRGCPRRAARARTVHHAVEVERKHLVLRGAPLGLRGRVGRAPAEPPAGALAAVVAAALAAAAAHARHPAHARRPAQAVLRASA